MRRNSRVMFGLVAALVAIGAQARFHHICFEGEPEMVGSRLQRVVIAACEDDRGAACTIKVRATPVNYPLARQPVDLYPPAPGAYRDVRFYEFAQDLTIDFEFDGGVPRRCSMTRRLSSPPWGELTSFSTDASGLATTGVWRFHAKGGRSDPRAPGGFIAIGGGSAADQADAFVARSTRAISGDRTWEAGSQRELFFSPIPGTPPYLMQGDQTFGYVIGLRIADMSAADLLREAGLLDATSTSAPPTAAPEATVTAPTLQRGTLATLGPDAVVLGGGVYASTTSGFYARHVATASAPVFGREWFVCLLRQGFKSLCPRPAIVGWQAEARSPQGIHTDEVRAQVSWLPHYLTVRDPVTQVTNTWRLRVSTISGSTRPDVAPALDVAGLRGTHAITGIGAEVEWRGPTGNDPTRAAPMLSRLEPRADLGGASGAAQAGSMAALATPAALTVHAIGLQLVDAKAADEPVPVPERISTIDLCRADSALANTSICKRSEPLVLPPFEFCRRWPWLLKHGYCEP